MSGVESGAGPASRGTGRAGRWAARAIGILLLALTLTPVYRVLDRPDTGQFGIGTVIRGSTNLEAAWWGILLALTLGAGLALLAPLPAVRHRLARAGERLARVPTGRFAVLAAALAAGLALAAGWGIFQALPTLVDEMATLLHGRILASGRLALPLPDPRAAWVIPNTLVTPLGWVSQYPPLHPLLLAAGFWVSAPWLVGPLCLGFAVLFSVLVAARLFPAAPGVARLGGILLAFSPFMVFMAGGYLSHVPAAALGAFTLWAALAAREGRWGWAIAVGAGAGAMVATRPWTGLVMGAAFPALLWVQAGWAGRGGRWSAVRLAGACAGGLPVALGLAMLNARLFGGPLTLGYTLAYGSTHDLGFHRDPWGNAYGPLEALGYTAANLLTLGVYLLESALPALALVGAFLLLTPRLPRGSWVLLGWALLPALANLLYWHHGFHLGPRMLYEAAPAWVLLAALAAIGLAGPEPAPAIPAPRGSLRARLRPRDVLLGGLLVSVAGSLALIPLRAASYRWSPETLARITPPEVPAGEPALVFVHGSWEERIAARLQGTGMRLDSIETALRRNDICALQGYVDSRLQAGAAGAGPAPLPALDFQLLPDTPPHLRAVLLSQGEPVWVDPSHPFPVGCRREAEADRGGIVSLAPLVWQGDLPGLEQGRPLFVRDLGPDQNAAVLRAFPHRRPYLYFVPAPGWDPVLRDYGEGMELLWGSAGDPAGGGEGDTGPGSRVR